MASRYNISVFDTVAIQTKTNIRPLSPLSIRDGSYIFIGCHLLRVQIPSSELLVHLP